MDARHTFDFLINPERFMAFSRWAAPLLGVLASIAGVLGLALTFLVPEDYQQGDTVRMMFIHIPAASISLFIYLCLGVASFLALVFRQALAVQSTGLVQALSLSVCFGLAWLAHQAGLAPIVGAFAAGLILLPFVFFPILAFGPSQYEGPSH